MFVSSILLSKFDNPSSKALRCKACLVLFYNNERCVLSRCIVRGTYHPYVVRTTVYVGLGVHDNLKQVSRKRRRPRRCVSTSFHVLSRLRWSMCSKNESVQFTSCWCFSLSNFLLPFFILFFPALLLAPLNHSFPSPFILPLCKPKKKA